MTRFTCPTVGCEVHWHSTDEPGHCSMCLADLVPIDSAVDEWWYDRYERGEGPPPPRSCTWPMIDIEEQMKAIERARRRARMLHPFGCGGPHVEIVRPGAGCPSVEVLRGRGLRVVRLPAGRAVVFGSIGPL